MSWNFETAWAAALLAGIAFCVVVLVTPLLRLWAEHRAHRRGWRRRR